MKTTKPLPKVPAGGVRASSKGAGGGGGVSIRQANVQHTRSRSLDGYAPQPSQNRRQLPDVEVPRRKPNPEDLKKQMEEVICAACAEVIIGTNVICGAKYYHPQCLKLSGKGGKARTKIVTTVDGEDLSPITEGLQVSDNGIFGKEGLDKEPEVAYEEDETVEGDEVAGTELHTLQLPAENLKYRHIVNRCREEGKAFEDVQFSAKDKSLFYSSRPFSDEVEWKRIPDMCAEPHLFLKKSWKNKAELGDIIQSDYLGNCWFLGALSVWAGKKSLIEHVVPHRSQQEWQANAAQHPGVFR